MITDIDKAYLAGMIDGEGAIYICKYVRKDHGRVYSVNSFIADVSISNTNLAVIEWMQSLWGGYLNARKPRESRYRINYQLVWRRDAALRIIEDVLPYLRIKKVQAKLCKAMINYINNHPMPTGHAGSNIIKKQIFETRNRMSEAMTKLNHKGNHVQTKIEENYRWGNYSKIHIPRQDGKNLRIVRL